MKRIILVSAIALLAACGSTNSGVSVGAPGDQASTPAGSVAAADSASTTPSANSSSDDNSSDDDTATSIEGSDDTITVENFGDMPKECIDLLGTFLKKIEPAVSAIDWDKATYGEFQDFGKTFQPESDAFDAQSEAAGCNKYNLNGSDDKQFEQMSELAAVQAPGTVGFLKFLNSLSVGAQASGGSLPTDCAGTIAAIEPILATGGTLQDLTMVDFTKLGQLLTGVNDNCTSDEATAFFARDDVTAFINP